MFAASKSGSPAEATDAQFNYVTMLLHGDGTNGAQNNTFLDSSTNAFSITRNGNTTQGTFTPYGSNWSVSFTGAQTSPSLTYPSISAYDLGATSQWTYECWVYFASLSGEQSIMERWSGTGGPGWLLTKLSSNAYRAHFGSSVLIDTGAIAVAGQWIHLAVSRDGSTGSLFVDGVRQATTSSVVNFSDGTDPLVFGERNSGSQTFPFNGYISNARIVKSTYVYNPSSTTITVPTSPLTAITNTVFLGLQSNRYVDNSSNNATATASSASSVQRFSPFSPTTAYSTSVIGGSLYGDGTGDYLSIPYSASNSLNAGDFTVEAWIYKNTNAAYMAVGGTMTSAGPYNTKWQLFSDSGGTKISWCSDAFLITSSQTLYTGTWYHVAFVRSSGTLNLYINGVLDSSASDSRNYNSATELWVAQVPENVSGRNWNGYITNFRINPTTAVYTANFTPNTTPLTATSGTSFLLATTNAGIIDNAMMNDLETVGNAQISTSVKKYGTGSLAFDGTGDYLSILPTRQLDFGTGNWTLEMWLNLNTVSTAQVFVNFGFEGAPFTQRSFVLYLTSSNVLQFAYSTDGSSLFDTSLGASGITTGVWNHIAIVRNGSTITAYRNGTAYATTINIGTSPIAYAGGLFRIGVDGSNFTNGYIDDLRITKGVARYTANFTAPTAAFADKGPIT